MNETDKISGNPHSISAAFNIDPTYSADDIIPDRSGLSLFSEKETGPFWIYEFGSLEAYLLQRMRQEVFVVCSNVFYPGRFRTFHSTLFAKRSISLPALPENAKASIYACGHVTLAVNKQEVFRRQFPDMPQEYFVDLLSYLQEGLNEIRLGIHSIATPPTFLVQSAFLITDSNWSVSSDDIVWRKPECLPFEKIERFPHQENLPERISPPKSFGNGVYDFAVPMLGHPLISAQGKGNISMNVGESLAEALNTEPNCREQKILSPIQISDGIYKCKENLALRYLHITHMPDIQIKDVQLSSAFYPARYKGAFACSDECLTKVWMHAAFTLRLCMRELFIDGIKRDRLPWAGDLFLAGLCNCYSFYDKLIIRRTLIALYPEDPEQTEFNGIIDHSLLWVMALRDYIMYFGDMDFAEQIFPMFDRLMRAIKAKEDRSGLLPSHKFNWIFIDWATVLKDGYSSCLQMFYVMALEAAGDIYRIMGKTNISEKLLSKIKTMRSVCNEMFWSEDSSAYVDNVYENKQGIHVSRHANILAVLSGTADDTRKKDILENVFLNKRVEPVGSPYMYMFEARAVSRCGKKDEMLSMIRNYWGGMIQAGASTFWEAYVQSHSGEEHYSFYGRPYGKSLCHAWSAGPIVLLSGDVLGIYPAEAGWKRFKIVSKPASLDWICASIPCPQGTIDVDVSKNVFSVRIPKGATLEMVSPNGGIVEYTEGLRVIPMI